MEVQNLSTPEKAIQQIGVAANHDRQQNDQRAS